MVVDNGGNMEFPFKENIKEGIFERTFSQDVDNDEAGAVNVDVLVRINNHFYRTGTAGLA